jgi:hypothetical protein
VPALNNLADLLWSAAAFDEAHTALRTPPSLDGPYRATAAATLREIEHAR